MCQCVKLARVIARTPAGTTASHDTTPASRTDTPAPRTETPARRTDAPTPRTDTPAPRTETPARRTDTPTPRTDTPDPHTETPTSTHPTALATVILGQSRLINTLMGKLKDLESKVERAHATLSKKVATIDVNMEKLLTRVDEGTAILRMDSSPPPVDGDIDPLVIANFKRESTGPGNFALKLTSHLFPERFGRTSLRTEYNWFGVRGKKELDLERKLIIERYVKGNFPEVCNGATFRERVVAKVNEGLRRPLWSDRRCTRQPACDVMAEILHEIPMSDSVLGRDQFCDDLSS